MAALASTPTPLQCIQHARFSTKQHGYLLWHLSLNLSGNVAVAGRHNNGRTFIDLYFGRNSDCRDEFKLFYSKEFGKYSDYRLRPVSFLGNNDDSRLVTCIGDKIEIIDTKQKGKVLRSCKLKGETITCLAVREGEILIGLFRSEVVMVFNYDLKVTKRIKLRGIKDDWLLDLHVIKDTVFVRTGRGRAYSISKGDGSNVLHTDIQYTDTTGKNRHADSITVSEKLGLVAVLWYKLYPVKRGIIVYSLNEDKSLLVFPVDDDVTIIRISDKYRTMVTGNWNTGEIKMYDLEQLFSFEAMKRTLAYIVSPDECEELRKYFRVTEEELKSIVVDVDEESGEISDEDKIVREMECLLTIIEEKGHLNPYNLSNLMDAVSSLSDGSHIFSLKGPMEGYVLHGFKVSEMMTRQMALEDDRKQLSSKSETADNMVMMTGQKAWEDDRKQLSSKSETADGMVKEHEKTVNDLQSEIRQETKQSEEPEVEGAKPTHQLEGAKLSFDPKTAEIISLKEEIAHTKTKSAKEIGDLSEQLKLAKQTLDTSKKQSSKVIELLTEQLEEIKQVLDSSRAESACKIATLTDEIDRIITDSTKYIDTLTEEVQQTKIKSAKEIETLTEELKQIKQSNTESERQIEIITGELTETKQKLITRTRELETAKTDLEVIKQVLKETKQEKDITRIELRQSQLDFAKESRALKEVLNQTREAVDELQKRSLEDKPLVDSEETKDESVSVLADATEFGRLTVAIAEHLTLDNCLQLARICNIPVADCDTILRLSLIESPAKKFLDVLKERNIINMFDVTNLQKGLAMLHLEVVNHNLVIPYQRNIDEAQFEQHKTEEICSWEDVEEFFKPLKGIDSQILSEDDSEHKNTSKAEARDAQSEQEEDRGLISKDKHQHHLYTEQSIGRKGGTIYVANVSLIVPPDALQESHVIALSVMNESPFPLDREVDTARMTPIIKLEPLGLKFTKSLELNIPHSALIPEPKNHDAIIYLGKTSKNNEDSSDCIKWTEERSIPRQLKEKSLTVDIQCLSYLSASLVSQTTATPLHIARAVPFVDWVRKSNDDITLTVSFCNDSDTEYDTLLSDYKTKLPLEQYSTLQLYRHSENGEDDAGFLNVIVTSVNNTYMPDAEQAVKKFAVSHLCTASRVSHQFRLKKKLPDTDRDVLDIELTFSQAQYEATKISLKARIKDLTISEESEEFLTTGSLPPALRPYEDLKSQISGMLEKAHCRKLAIYFELSPAETDQIEHNQVPGKMLIKILDEREKIMPEKMIGLYQGLKFCHLDKIARLVFEYIEEHTKQMREKEEYKEIINGTDEKVPIISQYQLKKGARTDRSSLSDQSVQTTFSSSCVSSNVNVRTLISEGYSENEVIEALDISRNSLLMARKVLQFMGGELYVPPIKGYIFLHKEQYIDENGGEIILREANVHLLIPVGAVSKGSIVSLTMMTSKQSSLPSEGKSPQLSPVIKLGPESSTLNKPVTLRIPHCASEIDGITSTDTYLGFSREKIQWRKRKHHEPKPTLGKDHFEVSIQELCAIGMNTATDFGKPLSKKFRVLPVMSRIQNANDDLTVTLWIYNDDETEHKYLQHEEINVRGKIQLHNFKEFTLKGSEKEKEVHIKSGSSKIAPHASREVMKILATTLWNNARYAVEFRFQNKEGIGDISFRLKLCTRQLLNLRTVTDLQFDLKLTLSELLQEPRVYTRTLLQIQEPQPAMEKSFQEFVSKVSGQLDVDSCLEIVGMFGLSPDLKDKVKESSEPGKVLFDKLLHDQLITAASVSALDVALTRTGNEHLAEYVKIYRHKHATFTTTTFTLL